MLLQCRHLHVQLIEVSINFDYTVKIEKWVDFARFNLHQSSSIRKRAKIVIRSGQKQHSLGGDVSDDADAVLLVELEQVGEQGAEDDHDQLDGNREAALLGHAGLQIFF
jgi:hypothetical protein